MSEAPKNPLIEKAIATVGGSQSALAERIGRSQQYISLILNSRARIAAEAASAIHDATAGEVPKWDLRPDLFERPVLSQAEIR